jgi:Putative zinc binding domain
MTTSAILEKPLSATLDGCRSCGSGRLDVFLDLGRTPLADRLISDAAGLAAEPTFPLRVAICECCSLVQITETVDPEVLFADDYPYYSSFSPALLEHSRANVRDVIARREIGRDSFVVEIASNDGYLLKNYVGNERPWHRSGGRACRRRTTHRRTDQKRVLFPPTRA